MDYEVSVTGDGPLFEPGVADHIVEVYARNLENNLGDLGVAMIRAYLPGQYMYLGHNGGDPKYNPVPPNAGYYQSVIHTVQTEDAVLIHDTPCVYGPWIEGVGSKNPIAWPGRMKRGLSPRFPGYHAFRVIAQRLNGLADSFARAELLRYIQELNR